MELVVHKDSNILITLEEVHELMKQAENLYDVEAKLKKARKPKILRSMMSSKRSHYSS